MSLTAAQLEARAGRLTASRVGALMKGDPVAILKLYKQMIGEEQEDDLSQVWAVRLGECTEQLHLNWHQWSRGVPVTRRGEVVVHPKYHWAACTLDGWVEDN